MQSDLDGNNVTPFFRNAESVLSKECTCSYSPSVKPVMTIDKTNFQKPVMYWMSLEGHLNMADMQGCMCSTVLNASFSRGTSLTVDKMNVYWSDAENDRIYFARKGPSSSAGKEDEPGVKSFYLSSMRSIKAFGKSLQPYPAANCLVPRPMTYKVEKLGETASSITVQLPKPVPDLGCARYSLPTTLYVINVSQCFNNSDACEIYEGTSKIESTYDQEYEIRGLKPYTNYRLQLALSNYYADLAGTRLGYDAGVVFRTGAGTPSVPENVTVIALTPTLVAVYWNPPKILNSAAVFYDVHWRTSDLVNGMRPKGEQLIKEPKCADRCRQLTTLLPSLLPGREYEVYVRVYSVYPDVYNQSDKKNVRMYPEPNNLTLSGVSVNSLNVSWSPSVNPKIKHKLQYKDVAMKAWIEATNKVEKDTVTYYIEGLQPRTSYKFRLMLDYPKYSNYVWPSEGGFTFETLGK